MYSSTSPSVKSVVMDNQIKLPRFQRKKTWKDKARFELCISLFKGYPLGTIVVKKDEKGGRTTKWLLDGRQRKDTLVEMQNPETIYRWARGYLGFRISDSKEDIARMFRKKLDDYIQFEHDSEEDENSGEEYPDQDDTPGREPELDPGLNDLLRIICAVHPMRGKNSEFGKPFLFEGYRATYIRKDNETGRPYVDGEKLVKWLSPWIDNVDAESLEAKDIEEWFDNGDDNLRREVERNIGGIRNSVKTLQLINDRMNNAPILMIELDNSCESADSRKIFEIINTKGEPLTGAEILSAKPDWNVPVDVDDEEKTAHIRSLYGVLGTEVNDAVRWDIAATFTDSITDDASFILGDVVKTRFEDCRNNEKMFEQKMTAGFKLLSGRYLNSLTKNDIDRLPKTLEDEGGWEHIEFANEIAGICKVLLSDSAFEKFKRADVSLWDLLSNAIAMNFLLLMIKKWKELGKPTAKGNPRRETISCARRLFDRMFFEYCTSVWRGASDSRLTRNLEGDLDAMFEIVPEDEWNKLIDSVYTDNRIGGQPASQKIMKALLYYFTLVRSNIELGEGYEMDHVIPKGRITSSNQDADSQDTMINLALLPRDLNERKSENDISALDPESRRRICQFEDLDPENVIDMINKADFPRLREMRKNLPDTIKEDRKAFATCSGHWILN